MKRTSTVFGIALLIAALAVPAAFAWGPGWGRGHHMMGYGDRGPGFGEYDFREYGNATPEQRKRLEALESRFYAKTAELRGRITSKSAQLDAVLSASDPDIKKVKVLQKEISDLRAQLGQERVAYELESRRIAPDARFGRGWHMGGYGHGAGYGR